MEDVIRPASITIDASLPPISIARRLSDYLRDRGWGCSLNDETLIGEVVRDVLRTRQEMNCRPDGLPIEMNFRLTDYSNGLAVTVKATPAPHSGAKMPSYVITNAPQPLPVDLPFWSSDTPGVDVLGYRIDDFGELASDMRSTFDYCRTNSIKITLHTHVLNGEMSFGISLAKAKWGVDEHHSDSTLRGALGKAITALVEIRRRRDNVVRS